MDLDRRDLLRMTAMGAAAMPAVAHAGAASHARVTDLRVCGLATTFAFGARQPRFSWRIDGSVADQTHYRIVAASSRADLMRDVSLLWDSGKVASGNRFDIAYAGPPLGSRAALWWRAESWVGDRLLVSDPAMVETGLAAASDWSSDWLAVETEDARLDRAAGLHWLGTDPAHALGSICGFRTLVEADRAMTAELFLSAVALDGVWLNGTPLTFSQEESPAWTTMVSFSLSLRPGVNLLAVAVRRVSEWGVPSPVLAAIVRLPDPARRRLSTASGWQVRLNPPTGWQGDAGGSGWRDATAATRQPDGEPWPAGPAMLLRKDFHVDRAIRSARLYVAALAGYEAWINGRRVSDRQLSPEFTNPTQRISYQGYDVTDLLRDGQNAIGLWAGDGWYGSEISTRSRFPFGPAPARIRGQLEIICADGMIRRIGTDESWTTHPSPVIASEIYDGEVYDARLEQPGWATATFAGGNWSAACLALPPDAPIDGERSPPIRITATLLPVSVKQVGPGIHVFDFGQNFAGWAKLTVRGAAGERVELRYAEMLRPDGTIDQSNLRSALARDVIILKGDDWEVWEPRFTYHGFRYVELRGLPHAPVADTLLGQVVHSDLPVTGTFRVSDQVIQQFWRNSVWSQRSNFVGMPTDCPQRDERLGWMGDAQVFWPAAAYNMDLCAYTARVTADLRAAQDGEGRFPDVIPPLLKGRMTTSPGWADAGVILPHTAWRQYGDTAIIADNWAAMDRYMDWLLANNPDHRWLNLRGQDFGDWLAVDAKQPGDVTTPKDLIATAFWASDAAMMAEMATAVGRQNDAARYRALFGEIRSAFNAAHLRPDGVIGNNSQTSYILPIRFGLLSDAARAEAGRRLAANVASRGGTLSTGFLGTPHILDALVMSGQEATAITLLLQRRYPSWGYMVERGATTMWERWNSDTGDVSMNSFNHYAFGAIGSFLYRRIAGIDALEPGFRRIRIAPILDRRLAGAGADYRSASGLFRVDWQRTGTRVRLLASLPPNTVAELQLPPGAAFIGRQSPMLAAGRHVVEIANV